MIHGQLGMLPVLPVETLLTPYPKSQNQCTKETFILRIESSAQKILRTIKYSRNYKIKHSKVLYEKFLENCTDPIASVRQGGACSLGYLVKANQEFLDPIIKDGINI